jgi:hypothetical protein
MKYENKKIKKIKRKMIEYKAKEDLDDNQLERIEKLKRKRDILLSRGGKHERSHKKRVGNAVNKNIDKRYNIAAKVLERIESKRKNRS